MNRTKAARFWSAPAERGGDGALARLPSVVRTSNSRATRPQNPKRRGASLPVALQNAGAPCHGFFFVNYGNVVLSSHGSSRAISAMISSAIF